MAHGSQVAASHPDVFWCLCVLHISMQVLLYDAPGGEPGAVEFSMKYSPLYSNYRPHTAYFHMFEMCKTLALCFLIGIFADTSNTGSIIQVVLVLIVFIAYFVSLVMYFPFRDRMENWFQILCSITQLCVLVVCLLIGIEDEQGTDAQGVFMEMAMTAGTVILILESISAVILNIREACGCLAEHISDELSLEEIEHQNILR